MVPAPAWSRFTSGRAGTLVPYWTLAPHLGQNFAPAARASPHSGQNFLPAVGAALLLGAPLLRAGFWGGSSGAAASAPLVSSSASRDGAAVVRVRPSFCSGRLPCLARIFWSI